MEMLSSVSRTVNLLYGLFLKLCSGPLNYLEPNKTQSNLKNILPVLLNSNGKEQFS